MPWVGDEFRYTKGLLKAIAGNYISIYEGLPLSHGTVVTNPFAIAEFRADFDIALGRIGRGKWTGKLRDFKYYHNFGRLQQMVIADILGLNDSELEELGFFDIPRLRGYAYYLMCCVLNGTGGDK